MIDSFYSLLGSFDNTYFNMVVYFGCLVVILWLVTSFLQMLVSLFKSR